MRNNQIVDKLTAKQKVLLAAYVQFESERSEIDDLSGQYAVVPEGQKQQIANQLVRHIEVQLAAARKLAE